MLKNMKIGKRLITAFIIVALVAGASGILGVFLFAKIDADYSYALENYGFASGKIGMLSAKINENRAHIRDIVYQTDPSQLDAAYAKMQDSIAETDQLMEEVRATNASAAAEELFAVIEADVADYRDSRDQVVELGMANQEQAAQELLTTVASPKLVKLSDDVNALYQMNLDAGEALSNTLTQFGRVMLVVMIVCVIIGFAVAIIFAIFISRGISRPLISIEQSAEKMAVGDFDVQVDYVSNDEVGLLAKSMREMISTISGIIEDTSRALTEIANGNFDLEGKVEYVGVFSGIENAIRKIILDLSDTLSQIKTSAEQVSSGADQVSDGAQSLAQGATEQASSVQELSASINEVSEQVKDNASNAATASSVVKTVGETIHTSNAQMTDMMGAMSEISSSSSKIGKIIKTIEDIAFQTNILALNAAVEAARAGAAGKGFAVVADEVRSLATKSSEAARQTNVLIESSVHSVDNGVKIADATAKSLAAVVIGAQEITDLITKITEASTEQSSSIAQINLGVEQISSVVQMNSATSEESAAASEELSGQANMMKQMIARFNLKHMSQSPAPKALVAHVAVQPHASLPASSSTLF